MSRVFDSLKKLGEAGASSVPLPDDRFGTEEPAADDLVWPSTREPAAVSPATAATGTARAGWSLPVARQLAADPEAGTQSTFGEGHRAAAAADYLQIRDYLRMLYKRAWIIAAVMVIGLLGSLLYNAQATRVFEAWATLQIEADPNVLGLAQPLVDQRDWTREFLPTQLRVLESRELASIALEEIKRSQDRPRGPLPAVDDIVSSRTIDPVFNTRLVNIGVQSTDPVWAARIANALGRAYVRWNSQFKSSTTAESASWLKKQVEEQRRVVQESEAALQRYKKEHGAEALGERQNIVVQKLADLQGTTTRARAETIDKETQYRQLANIQAGQDAVDTLPAIASNVYIQSAKDELAGLERQLAQASEQLGELHPDIIRLKAAIANAERKLRTETAKAAASIRNQYEAARARETALQAAVERQKLEVQDLNAKAVEYTALDRTATANRLLLDNLEQRSKQITLARDLPSAHARLLDEAQVPSDPILPRKQRNALMGISGGGFAAVALIFLLELFNTRVESADDIKRHLRVPLLGVAPHVKTRNGHEPLLLTDGAPPEFAELLHGVRTSLVMAPELAHVRTLLVTSSEVGEGKTVAAANLAVSLARLNQRVLLIDADLRKPRLHAIFGFEVGPGLSDLLIGKSSDTVFRKTQVGGLWLLPSGNASRNPADLLGSEHFKALVDSLQRQFDWIVLDSPPVLAVTDPCLIARVTSGVLLVVGRGQASRERASAAVERLEAVGANLVGAMLNRAALGRERTAYESYYVRAYQADSPPPDDGLWLPQVPGRTVGG
jgi:succinoglycan biosynthesis transport protein ExoP